MSNHNQFGVQQNQSISFLKKSSCLMPNTMLHYDIDTPRTPTLRISYKEDDQKIIHDDSAFYKINDSHLFVGNNFLEKHRFQTFNNPNKSDKQEDHYKQANSLKQSGQVSSHENSQKKKFTPSQFNLSQKFNSSNSHKGKEQKFLIINPRKQKYNNNYLFLNCVDSLKEEAQKYQISIQKLKEQNSKLRAEKVKLESADQPMQLIQLRLEAEAVKKRIKLLQNKRQQMRETLLDQKYVGRQKEQQYQQKHFLPNHCYNSPRKYTTTKVQNIKGQFLEVKK